jgi:hypothetical protein
MTLHNNATTQTSHKIIQLITLHKSTTTHDFT